VTNEKKPKHNLLPNLTNLGNPTRLAAIEKLIDNPMSVTELAQALGPGTELISPT
jgi:DNA-binding transcriptional ArsR family regulator